jgi:hypothetical protein
MSSSTTPVVSVVMPVYNGARHLQAAIDSILTQTARDIELIVVDDGSSDATPEMLAGVTDPRVRVVRTANGGPVAARIAGVAVARGTWVAWMDADDRCHPNRLERQLRFLDAHPECLFVLAIYGIMTPYGRYLTRIDTFDWRYLDAADLTFATMQCADPSGMFNRARGVEVGLLDPDLRDEKPLWYKLLRVGRGAVLGDPVYWYRWTIGSVSRDLSQSAALAETNMAVRRRHDPERAGDPRVAASTDVDRFRTRFAAKAVDYYLLAGDTRAAREVALAAWRQWPRSRRAIKLVLMALLRRRSLRRLWVSDLPHPRFAPADPPWLPPQAGSARPRATVGHSETQNAS